MLSSEVEVAVTKLLSNINMPEGMTIQQAVSSITSCLSEVHPGSPSSEALNSGEEAIVISAEPDGKILSTETAKLSNLKFKIGPLLFEVGVSALAVSGSTPDARQLAVLVIRFLQRAKHLASMPVSKVDAEVLLTIYRVSLEHGVLTIDQLSETTEAYLPSANLPQSLERLEQLGCISLDNYAIRLNESVTVTISE